MQSIRSASLCYTFFTSLHSVIFILLLITIVVVIILIVVLIIVIVINDNIIISIIIIIDSYRLPTVSGMKICLQSFISVINKGVFQVILIKLLLSGYLPESSSDILEMLRSFGNKFTNNIY